MSFPDGTAKEGMFSNNVYRGDVEPSSINMDIKSRTGSSFAEANNIRPRNFYQPTSPNAMSQNTQSNFLTTKASSFGVNMPKYRSKLLANQ